MSEFDFIPTDRTMKRETYKVIRRFFRWYFWKHGAEIKAEELLRMRNYYTYGTTHPEIYK